MQHTVEADIAIVGGGITGLWLLNQLRQQGYSVILLESGTLGGGQTHKAQGIIHGGMKYALQGTITDAAKAIANMPAVWDACLRGQGVIDLTQVPVLSAHQYLWTTGSLTSKIAGFFAGLALQGNVTALTAAHFPEIFQSPDFKGQVYLLEEMVIDIHALVRELAKLHQENIFKIDAFDPSHLHLDEQHQVDFLELHATPLHPVRLRAKKYIFTAGSGNEALLQNFPAERPHMQIRPLHMVMVKHDYPQPVYAHCLGLGTAPRLTITSHRAHDGRFIWYIGGQIAEEGITRNATEQIDLARKELQELFSWLDFSSALFASFKIDRAEVAQPDGKRPDTCFMQALSNTIIAWPTKLAFAPLLAEQISQTLRTENLKSGKMDLRELRAWPMPAFTRPMWDRLFGSR